MEEYISTLQVPIKVAVLGCAVNGPGEAREADIGIAGARGEGLLFRKGQLFGTRRNNGRRTKKKLT